MGDDRAVAGGRLAGKVAVVSGAASGIGEAIVRRFRQEGASVLAIGLQPERLEALSRDSGAEWHVCDISDEAAVQAAIANSCDVKNRKRSETEGDAESEDQQAQADEAEDGSYHQTSGSSQDKPKQRPKDLAAIQRINGQNVESEQFHVNFQDLCHQAIEIGHGVRPSERSSQQDQSQ